MSTYDPASYNPYQAPEAEAKPSPESRTLAIGPLVRDARRTLRDQPIVIVAYLLQLAGTWGAAYGWGRLSADWPAGGLIAQALTFATSTYFSIGGARIALDAARGKKVRLMTLLSGSNAWVPSMLAGIVTAFAMMVGFVLLIVPGIYVTLGLAFAPILLADRSIGAKAALEESMALTRGHKWKLAQIYLVCSLIVLAGFLALVAGALIALPLTQLIMVHAYLRLTGERA